jgi:uridine nucleosidase
LHGNATVENTTINAARCLHAFAAPAHVKVYSGAAAPLIRPARHDPEIHGPDGLGGVEGLPSADSDPVRERIDQSRPAIEAIAAAIVGTRQKKTSSAGDGDGGGDGDVRRKAITIVASGPLTNVALFVSVYPHLLDAVERIVFMGGGIGIGNRSAVAGEFRVRVILNNAFAATYMWTDV